MKFETGADPAEAELVEASRLFLSREDVGRLLRGRHAGIEPDVHFVNRVVAGLPRATRWTIAWTARQIFPVSLVFAVALLIAVVATGRSASRTTSSTSGTTAETESDPLEWLLESHEERR